MAGATAFFTIFALPPILIIIIQVLGLFIEPDNISQKLFSTLSGQIGASTTQQVINTFRAIRQMANNWTVIILGFIFLLFVATTLFKVVQNSINQVWKIKVVEKEKISRKLLSRVRAIVVILLAGILFLMGIIADAGQAYLGKLISEFWPSFLVYFNSVLGYLLSVFFVMIWFMLFFKFLPNGNAHWKVALVGGLMTSILFNLGKFVLRTLLYKSNINSFYGASGSIVLLMLFVFYSSLIIYYGAAFTKIWGMRHNRPIKPGKGAIAYHLEPS